jgi:hypothetical protein
MKIDYAKVDLAFNNIKDSMKDLPVHEQVSKLAQEYSSMRKDDPEFVSHWEYNEKIWLMGKIIREIIVLTDGYDPVNGHARKVLTHLNKTLDIENQIDNYMSDFGSKIALARGFFVGGVVSYLSSLSYPTYFCVASWLLCSFAGQNSFRKRHDLEFKSTDVFHKLIDASYNLSFVEKAYLLDARSWPDLDSETKAVDNSTNGVNLNGSGLAEVKDSKHTVVESESIDSNSNLVSNYGPVDAVADTKHTASVNNPVSSSNYSEKSGYGSEDDSGFVVVEAPKDQIYSGLYSLSFLSKRQVNNGQKQGQDEALSPGLR